MELIPTNRTALRSVLVVLALYVASTTISRGQTYTVLTNVPGPYYGGAEQASSLAQGTNGNLFGTTQNGDGTIAEITEEGRLAGERSFSGTNGYSPSGPVVLGTDGKYYA